MKKIKELLKEPWFANSIAICSGILFCFILVNIGNIFTGIKNFLGFFSPILTGLIIAYFINPLVNVISKKILRFIKNERFRHILAVTLSILIIISGLILLIITFIPSLVDSTKAFASNIDIYIKTLNDYLEIIEDFLIKLNIDTSNANIKITEILENIISTLPNKLSLLLNKSYNIGLGIANLVISFILAIYFLIGREKLIKDFKRLEIFIKDKESLKKQELFLSRCNDILIRFIYYDLIDGIIIGTVNAIIMFIFDMPYIALVSIIVGITNLLPTFGPIIGGFLGFIILVLNDPMQAFIFLIVTIILQTIDGYILKPKMFGNAFDVPAVWTLIAIIIGGKMFGIIGIFLAIPFAAVITFAYKEIFIIWYNEYNNVKKNKDKKEK